MAAPRSFVAGTATAVAPVAAIPTTAAHFALWNGEEVGGKTYTITSVGFTTTTSAGATIILQQLAHCSVARIPLITGTAATAVRATDGIPGGSKAVVASAVTIVNANGLWHPVGSSFNTAALTATIASGGWTYVKGMYRVPPGGVFSLATLCSAAGSAACQSYVTWEEEQI